MKVIFFFFSFFLFPENKVSEVVGKRLQPQKQFSYRRLEAEKGGSGSSSGGSVAGSGSVRERRAIRAAPARPPQPNVALNSAPLIDLSDITPPSPSPHVLSPHCLLDAPIDVPTGLLKYEFSLLIFHEAFIY